MFWLFGKWCEVHRTDSHEDFIRARNLLREHGIPSRHRILNRGSFSRKGLTGLTRSVGCAQRFYLYVQTENSQTAQALIRESLKT